jgi:hypothetical protein
MEALVSVTYPMCDQKGDSRFSLIKVVCTVMAAGDAVFGVVVVKIMMEWVQDLECRYSRINIRKNCIA